MPRGLVIPESAEISLKAAMVVKLN